MNICVVIVIDYNVYFVIVINVIRIKGQVVVLVTGFEVFFF